MLIVFQTARPGWRSNCEGKVFSPRTQHDDLAQGSNTDRSIWSLVALTSKTTLRLNPASPRTASRGLINCHGNQFQPHVVLATTCCCIQRLSFFPAKTDITQGLDVWSLPDPTKHHQTFYLDSMHYWYPFCKLFLWVRSIKIKSDTCAKLLYFHTKPWQVEKLASCLT